MNHYLTLEKSELEVQNSYWTAREICQQPRVWREAQAAVGDNRESIDKWLKPLLEKPDLHIILSGAGSSALIGETLVPWFRKKLNRRFDAVSTTDLVSAPRQTLAENLPTLMISFARSGNSPESVASIDVANQILDECYHLILTCNPEGYLAQSALDNPKMLCLLMPEDSNDRSFAMTSSFSSMLVSCATIFTPNPKQLELAVNLTEQVIDTQVGSVQLLAQRDFSRLVILGAGCLLGTAREACLKCLELSAGKVAPLFDTPLGFRHGPKLVIDNTTVLVLLQSADPYVQLYDQDLLNEIKRDNQAAEIVILSPKLIGAGDDELEDLWLSLPYIVYCQMLAFFKALALNISADNPCPSGEVNRVVKGVIIHTYT